MNNVKLLFFQSNVQLSKIIFRTLHDKPKSSSGLYKLIEMKKNYVDTLKLDDKIKNLKDFKTRLDPKAQKDKIINAVVKKSTKWQEWYVRSIGLDEVQKLQKREIAMQDQLTQTQLERREIDKKLKDHRRIRNDLQDKLHKINRYQDDQSRKLYMELICQESDVVATENDLSRQFEEIDKVEREHFAAFCNAIRDSHEKQRAQTEYTKYFGLILSIIGTVFGSILTMIINAVRTKDLVSGIEKGVHNQMETIMDKIIAVDLKLRAIHDTQKIQTKENLHDAKKVKKTEVKQSKSYYDYFRWGSTQDSTTVNNIEASQMEATDENKSSYVNTSLVIFGVFYILRIFIFGY